MGSPKALTGPRERGRRRQDVSSQPESSGAAARSRSGLEGSRTLGLGALTLTVCEPFPLVTRIRGVGRHGQAKERADHLPSLDWDLCNKGLPECLLRLRAPVAIAPAIHGELTHRLVQETSVQVDVRRMVGRDPRVNLPAGEEGRHARG